MEGYKIYKEKRREVKMAEKEVMGEIWIDNEREFQGEAEASLFYRTLKQIKGKKEYNMANIRDKDPLYIKVQWRDNILWNCQVVTTG